MTVTPEQCGISSRDIRNMIEEWNENGFAMHSVLLARHGQICYEGYWAPFHREALHRMNSVTKSFVGIATGLLIEDGLLSMEDRLIHLFPAQLPPDLPPEFGEVTVRDLLRMRTCITPGSEHWIRDRVRDRAKDYFRMTPSRPADTLFYYDTTAAFLLTRIIEDRTGKPFMDYLRERVLSKIGFSPNAVCIKGNDGYSWGDSGLLCTARDLFLFAEFLRLGGAWNGEQLIDPAFVREAIAKQTATNDKGWENYSTHGYGYQIWKTWDDGFAFFGMGDQIMLCFPQKELTFVCNADNQGNSHSRMMILDAFRRNILCRLSDTPIAENNGDTEALQSLTAQLELVSLRGTARTAKADAINGRRIRFADNPMGIRWCRFVFDGNGGQMEYENNTGTKTLPFSFGENAIAQFPEEGYPDMEIRDFAAGNRYPCATSAAWFDERTLAIKCFMIGKHLGALYVTVGFREDGTVGMRMLRNTNCFLSTYNGYAAGKIE